MPVPGPPTVLRLLSPTKRRIVTIDAARRQHDPHIETCLRTAGWTEYRGPGKVTSGIDESGRGSTVGHMIFRGARNGWVIKGTDPTLDSLARPIDENNGRD